MKCDGGAMVSGAGTLLSTVTSTVLWGGGETLAALKDAGVSSSVVVRQTDFSGTLMGVH
jgi:hypothetical protein